MAAAEAPPNVGRAPLNDDNLDPKTAAIRAELDRILSSPQFRGTKRSQEFLSFIVERKLLGQTEMLKERWIGVEIFGRAPDYDTGEDSIVRVKANEVRKRLAQYHMEVGTAPVVEIELPPGSYVPDFRWVAPPETPVVQIDAEKPLPVPPPPSPDRRPDWRMIGAVGALAVAGIGLAWFGLSRHSSPIDRFWEPVVSSGRPVLICVAHPSVHHLAGQTLKAVQNGEKPVSVPMSDITVDPDHYVGVGDALALANISSFFARQGKPAQMRFGNDMSFADLRNSPSVLIGAFTNQWTMQVQAGMRFVFERDGGTPLIRDQKIPGRRWIRQSTPPLTDYAVVSRIFDSRTGQPVIMAAGLWHAGTQTAGEFLTSPEAIQSVLASAKPGWEKQNLQILLQVDVVGKTPGPPKVLETYFWPR